MKSSRYIYIICSLVSVILLNSSCKSVSHIEKKRTNSKLNESEVLDSINYNKLDYNTLFFKKVDVKFSNGDKDKNLKANIMIERDSFIQVSLTAPLGMEVARILFTQDSVKFLNIFNKTYALGDYDLISDEYSINVSYSNMQNILTNNLLNFDLGKKIKYKFEEEDTYNLFTLYERKLNKKLKKFNKGKDVLVLKQKSCINKDYFRLKEFNIIDFNNNFGASFNYNNFSNYGEKIFPQSIKINIFYEEKTFNLELKFDKIDFNVGVRSNLIIPAKYKSIN